VEKLAYAELLWFNPLEVRPSDTVLIAVANVHTVSDRRRRHKVNGVRFVPQSLNDPKEGSGKHLTISTDDLLKTPFRAC
jgi:hypothetical protein